MASVVIQLGQCGNQLGEQIFDDLFHSAAFNFFSPERKNPMARSVLVDMEPKVVQSVLHREQNRAWVYDPQSSVLAQSGSGNNWAFGFNHHGPRSKDDICAAISRQVERCDRLDSFCVVQSVAGGTGSGLGAYTLQILADEFSHRPTCSLLCFPFETGDVNLQSYNAMLSVVAANEYADLILAVDNAEYKQIAQERGTCVSYVASKKSPPSSAGFGDRSDSRAVKSLSTRSNRKVTQVSSSFAAVNNAIAFNVAGVLGVGGSLSHKIHLCGAHPAYKLSTLRGVPQIAYDAREFTDHSWESLCRGLEDMIRNRRLIDRRGQRAAHSNRALASFAAVRGRDCIPHTTAHVVVSGAGDVGPHQPLSSASIHGTAFSPCALSCSSSFHSDGITTATVFDDAKYQGLDRSLFLLRTDQTPVGVLNKLWNTAGTMVSSRAYVHHFEHNGVELDDLEAALMNLAQITSDYEKLWMVTRIDDDRSTRRVTLCYGRDSNEGVICGKSMLLKKYSRNGYIYIIVRRRSK